MEHLLCQDSSLLLPNACLSPVAGLAGSSGTEAIDEICFVLHSCWLFFYSYPLWPKVTGCFFPARSLHSTSNTQRLGASAGLRRLQADSLSPRPRSITSSAWLKPGASGRAPGTSHTGSGFSAGCLPSLHPPFVSPGAWLCTPTWLTGRTSWSCRKEKGSASLGSTTTAGCGACRWSRGEWASSPATTSLLFSGLIYLIWNRDMWRGAGHM